MSDRSWTIAPAFVWLGLGLAVALYAIDGDVSALANRLTKRRDAAASPASGPVFQQKPIVVAEGDTDNADDKDERPATRIAENAGALADTCVDGTPDACKRWAMDGFYRAVGETKRGKLGRAVRVSWYGDSVVATDAIPGRLRTRLQTELGDGGPGFVYVVAPHRFCGHEAITRVASSDWTTHAISTLQIADGLYGVGGATAEASDGRATVKLVTGKATSVELYYLAQPKGGTAVVTGDGAEILRAETKADAKQPGYAAATTAGVRELKIKTEG